jgi:hypothetical protein
MKDEYIIYIHHTYIFFLGKKGHVLALGVKIELL